MTCQSTNRTGPRTVLLCRAGRNWRIGKILRRSTCSAALLLLVLAAHGAGSSDFALPAPQSPSEPEKERASLGFGVGPSIFQESPIVPPFDEKPGRIFLPEPPAAPAAPVGQ